MKDIFDYKKMAANFIKIAGNARLIGHSGKDSPQWWRFIKLPGESSAVMQVHVTPTSLIG